MPEIRVTVRDRLGQAAHRTFTIEVAKPGLPGPVDVRRPGRPRQRIRLGQILIEAGLVTQAQLQQALARQRETGERLGQIILGMGLGSQEGVAAAIAQQLGIPFVRLSETRPDVAVLLRVPEFMARRHQVIPIRQTDRSLLLGMVDPVDILAIDDVRRETGLEIDPAVITADDFQRALSVYPTPVSVVDEAVQDVVPLDEIAEDEAPDRLKELADEAPVVRLANLIIVQAVRQAASDIHVEPMETMVRVRYRVDGSLYNAMTPPVHVKGALVSRLKIMATMNIAERRIPQDGRIQLKVDDRDIDLRVSSIPTTWGEKIVMRILDKRGAFVGIDKLGMAPQALTRFEKMISRPHGILLITGPTGSGKSTSLYAVLNRLNKPEVNITTVEDPVEYQLSGISQVQVNPRAGVTFATALRAFLRQDPDIIMVGEIRDEETARIAAQAALTGHLVLSTLHTNDAAGAVARLTGMGLQPFLVASSLIGVVAQRLIKVLCERCKEAYTPPEDLLRRLGLPSSPAPTFYKATGCAQCGQSGYKGRIGIFEVMPLDGRIKDLITRDATADEIRAAAVAAGMRTLSQDALDRVVAGVTSLEEARRVVFTIEQPGRRATPIPPSPTTA
jgi:type IV pilus assembly protein PilB